MTRPVIWMTAAVLAIPRVALACPVCFGAGDGPMVQGSSMGILALLIVTVGMFAAFGTFFLHLARRASVAERDAQQPGQHWQGGTVR